MNDYNAGPKERGAAVLEPASGRRLYLLAKRSQDIALSALALAALSPLLLIISLLIVLDDPHAGPIFSQVRCGKNGRKFTFYKFRTMHADAEKRLRELYRFNEMNGPAFKMKNDPRITRFGGLLRRTSLDELPQLLNVLRGDMSLVGPRPPLPQEVAQYTPAQMRRLAVTPGLTCFWQTHPDRYNLSFDQWVELDVQYIRERSWGTDWRIIFRTVKVLFRLEGE